MHSREEQIEQAAQRAHESTFDWVLSDNEHELQSPDEGCIGMKARFREWLHGNGALFWICGKAASGKSTLMRKIYYDERLQHHLKEWAPVESITFARVFFSSEGSELQKSREGLLRSLIHQATCEPDLAMQALQAYLYKVPEDGDYEISKVQWTWSELRNAFTALLSEASSTRRFLFFVDGLDEYHSTPTVHNYPPEYHLETGSVQGRKIRADYRDIAQLLQTLPRSAFVKICVSSRPYNEFEYAFSRCPNFRLELLTKDDMEEFVQTEMSKWADATTVAEYADCVGDIRAKASGVFLWVKIATEILVDGMINGIDPGQLRRRLDDLPSELGGPSGLYMRILQRLDHELLSDAWKMFDLVLLSRRDLSALSLSLAANATPVNAVAVKINALSNAELEDRCTKIRRRLKSQGGLLETEGTYPWDKVRFMHLTAKEFLLRADVQHILTTDISSARLDPSVALLAGCLLHIKCLDVSVEPITSMRLWENIKDGLYYAAHAERSIGVPQTALLDCMNETVLHIWKTTCESTYYELAFEVAYENKGPKSARCHWADAEPQECGGKNYAWKDDFMSLAVQANLTLYIQEKFQAGYRISDKKGRPMLAYAIVPTRLSTMMQYDQGRGCDTLGANYSNVSTIKLLLDHGADPNAIDEHDDSWNEFHSGAFIARQSPFSMLQTTFALGPLKRKLSRPSFWQLSIASARRCVNDESHKLSAPKYSDWLETMKVLLGYGVSPNVVVRWETGRRKHRPTHIHSALFLAFLVSMECFDCSTAAPRLLMSKGGRLRAGEEVDLRETLRESPAQFDKRFAFLRSFFPSVQAERPSDESLRLNVLNE